MINRRAKNNVSRLLALSACCSAGFIQTTLAETTTASRVETSPTTSFQLAVTNNLVSLTAKNAELDDVLQELSRQLHIAIESHVTDQKTVNADFNFLTVKDAMQQLGGNYATIVDEKTGQVTKIVLYPLGTEQQRALSGPSDMGRNIETMTRPVVAPSMAEQHPAMSTRIAVAQPVETASPATHNDNTAAAKEESAPFEFSFDPTVNSDN